MSKIISIGKKIVDEFGEETGVLIEKSEILIKMINKAVIERILAAIASKKHDIALTLPLTQDTIEKLEKQGIEL